MLNISLILFFPNLYVFLLLLYPVIESNVIPVHLSKSPTYDFNANLLSVAINNFPFSFSKLLQYIIKSNAGSSVSKIFCANSKTPNNVI